MKTFRFLALLLALAGVAGAQAQSLKISGTVTDGSGAPLRGVTVVEQGTTKGVSTDAKGFYTISVPKGATLVFSYIGYDTQKRKVAAAATVNVVLRASVVACEEQVVVEVGYGTRNRKELTGHSPAVKMAYDALQLAAAPNDYYPGGEEHASFRENRFITVDKQPLSTFSLDVDGASYTNARRKLSAGVIPDKDAVRTEEFVNYFSYNYPKPTGSDPLRITCEAARCPWNPKNNLVRIGIKAREIPSDNLPATNFVFLIDVSGSMYGRLPLVRSSMKLLVNNLRAKDRVSIVTYAGAAGLALPATSGEDRQKIREALDALTAGGSTAGGEGIRLAYKTARANFIAGGNNRIILCTDGDFNVGVSSVGELEKLIEQERKSGVFLSVLGYGMGNYKDDRMQTLAEKGNGNYAYIDNLQEANKVLVSEFGSTMYVVAKDAKLQVEFNPACVQAYRLVGYESRLLRDEDFNDDRVDAGDIGAGHCVTALYEVIPASAADSRQGTVDPLKYQRPTLETPSSAAEMMTVKLRYKAPDGDVSKKMEVAVPNRLSAPSADFRFASAVAMFAQLVRDSDFKGEATYAKAVDLARQGLDYDPAGYRGEFVRIASAVETLVK